MKNNVINHNHMKINHLIFSLIFFFIGFSQFSYGQQCREFHKSKDCRMADIEGLKLSSLSRSHYLEVGKTVTYEVVLYGQKEIIIQCCTEEKYYPIHFKLKSSVNGDLIYDNKYDNYINTISLALDRTELISIEITLVSDEKNVSVMKGTKACVGMAIYVEKTGLRQ